MNIPEQASAYLDTFPLRYKTFFEGLLDDHIDLSWVLRYADLLKTPHLVQKTIPSLVDELQQFAVAPEYAAHPEVRTGREILRKFFEKKQQMLRKHHIIPFVYGSLIYDDPHNLDYDVVLFGQQYEPYVNRLCTLYLSDEINALWQSDHKGHITYTTTQQIETIAELFRDDTHAQKINTDAFDIQCLLSDVSIVFSGSPILADDTPPRSALRERCTTFMLQEPLIAALVAFELQEALKVRQKRRGL